MLFVDGEKSAMFFSSFDIVIIHQFKFFFKFHFMGGLLMFSFLACSFPYFLDFPMNACD